MTVDRIDLDALFRDAPVLKSPHDLAALGWIFAPTHSTLALSLMVSILAQGTDT